MLNKLSHYALATFYNVFIGIFSIFVLTKFYDVVDFGKIALFILIGNVAGTLLTFGLGKATQRFYFESIKFESFESFESFKVLNFSNLITILLIFLFFFPFIYIFTEDLEKIFNINLEINFFIISYIYGFFNITYLYFINLIISQKKSKVYLTFAVCYSTSNILLTIFLIFFFNDSYLSRIYSLLFINILFSLIIIYYNISNLKLRLSINKVLKSFKFSLPGYPSTLVGIIHSNFDKTFLAMIQNIASLGVLDISNRIGLISKMFIDFIIKAWIPEFMTNANKDDKTKIVKNYKQIIFFFGIFIFCLSLFSKEILWILTSEEFYIAKNFIPLICLGVFINHLFTLVASPSIVYAKKLQKNFIPSVIALIFSVVLNIVLIPIYGVMGVIVSMIISGLVSGCILFYYSQQCFKLNISNFFIFKNIVVITTFVAFIYILDFLSLSYFIEFIIKIFLLVIFVKLTFTKELKLEEFINKIKNLIISFKFY